MSGAGCSEGEEPQPVDSILYVASMAVPGSAPTTSIWPAFLHGAAFGAGILTAFAAFCGVLLAGDAARRRAVARARLRRALSVLDAEDIVTLIQQQGNAELRRAAGRPWGVTQRHREAVARHCHPGLRGRRRTSVPGRPGSTPAPDRGAAPSGPRPPVPRPRRALPGRHPPRSRRRPPSPPYSPGCGVLELGPEMLLSSVLSAFGSGQANGDLGPGRDLTFGV